MKLLNRKRRYIVGISSHNKIEFIEVEAKNKKEALTMVTEVLIKCSIFPFISENEFTLECKRIKSTL